jgi:hypothetical protein
MCDTNNRAAFQFFMQEFSIRKPIDGYLVSTIIKSGYSLVERRREPKKVEDAKRLTSNLIL